MPHRLALSALYLLALLFGGAFGWLGARAALLAYPHTGLVYVGLWAAILVLCVPINLLEQRFYAAWRARRADASLRALPEVGHRSKLRSLAPAPLSLGAGMGCLVALRMLS